MSGTGPGRGMPPGGEVVVVGLGASGLAASRLLRERGYRVYASDSAAGRSQRAAASALREIGIDAVAGGHDLARIARASMVVMSPGIPPDAPAVRSARTAGVEVVSEVELALRLGPGLRYIAVTGTNGKTTTTSLVAHFLRALGASVAEGGNIGTPLSELVLRPDPPEWVALEISSFQLHDTPGIAPEVGIVTNLAPDHLDRYVTVAEYYADKMLLFRNAGETSRWVLNGGDPTSAELLRPRAGRVAWFNVDGAGDATFDRATGELVVLGEPLARRSDLPLLGDHNVANALAALLAVMLARPEHATPDARAALAASLPSVRPQPHRLQPVHEADDILWINDSKATNVASALVAIAGMRRPTILLMGGRHKGQPYDTLAPAIAARVKHLLAYGEAAPLIDHDLRGVVPTSVIDGSFEEVVAHARELARPGDAVLLAPACSSFDMFRDYRERGERFAALARGETT